MLSRRRWILAPLIVILTLWGTIDALLNSIRVEEPGEAQRVYDSTLRRLQMLRHLPAEQNGFEALRTILSRDSAAEVKEPYEALAQFAVSASPGDIEEALGKNPQRAEAAVRRFEVVLPMLTAAIERPYFVDPMAWMDDGKTLDLNFSLLRKCCQSLVVLGLYYEAHGRPELAIDCYLRCLQLGVKIGKSGPLITQMIAVALERMSFKPLLRAMETGNLSPQCLRHVHEFLTTLPIAPTDYVDTMDAEYVFAVKAMERPDVLDQGPNLLRDESTVRPLVRLVLRPFQSAYVHRMRNVYTNLYLAQRPYYETLHNEPLAAAYKIHLPWLESRFGDYLPEDFQANTNMALLQFMQTRTSLSALEVVTALQVCHLENGSYPTSLAALCPKYFPAVPTDYMSSDGTFMYSLDGDLVTLTSQSPRYALIKMKSPYGYWPIDP